MNTCTIIFVNFFFSSRVAYNNEEVAFFLIEKNINASEINIHGTCDIYIVHVRHPETFVMLLVLFVNIIGKKEKKKKNE